jgi:hypothetical protein
MTVVQQPRHFHANERFFVEMTFESPLPEGAVPLAEMSGPIGPGGPALTFWTTTAAEIDGSRRTRMRLIGKIPEEAPPGLYRIMHCEVRWTADMPLSWVPVVVPLGGLGGDVLISVDVPAERSQPEIPRVTAAG